MTPLRRHTQNVNNGIIAIERRIDDRDVGQLGLACCQEAAAAVQDGLGPSLQFGRHAHAAFPPYGGFSSRPPGFFTPQLM